MPTVVATGQMTLLDLNDAFVAGTQPSNPIEGMLWVDTSTTPSKLKIYKLGTWVPQTLSLIDLDPDYGAQKGKIDDLIDDAKLSHTERGDLATILYELIPVLPSTGTALSLAGTSADTAAELFAGATWQTGLVYQIRKAALDVGLLSSHASFVATKTKYNAMVTQLNLMKTASAPIIYGWEVSSTHKATFVPVANADAFRTALKELYQALNALATLTTDFVNDEAIYRASYGNQLVGNAYGDTGTNRNFSSFTFTTAQKVTGQGSFSRTQTGVVFSDEFIPVDPSRNYVLRLQIKGSTTAGKQVIGVICYNSAGGSIGERYIVRDNTNSYFLPYTTEWSAYRGRIGGLGGGTDVTSSMFPVGTDRVKIYFSTNLYTTTNTAFFADIEFDVEKIESGVDYNGINLSGTSGITVESLKNTLTMNATKGIEIIKKTDPSNPIFKVDSNTGDLMVKGNIQMTSGSISWADIGAPSPAQVGAATPGEVSSAVTSGVAGIKVGGRNLLSDSGRTVSTASYGMTVYPLTKTIAHNTQVTVSMKATLGPGKRYFGLYNSGGTLQVASLQAAQLGADGVYRLTFFWSVGSTANTNLTIYHMDSTTIATSTIEWIKLEEGNKATDWTPAPEDIKTEVNAFRTAAAATGLVTVIDQNTVQTGRVRADYLDVKGLTVNNGATDTFKIDAGGNATFNGTVTVNSASNTYTKQDSQTIAVNTNNVGLGMKMNFSSFSGAATNRVYFHGFSYNDTSKSFVAADVNGYFYSYDNTTRVPATKGALDVSAGTPLTQGYAMYDTAYGKFYFIRFDVASGNWYRYNAADSARHNQVFTFTSTMYIIADLDLAS